MVVWYRCSARVAGVGHAYMMVWCRWGMPESWWCGTGVVHVWLGVGGP